MMEQKRSQKGITLIALVITIIILLILAGVTISMTVGQNGILKHAETAVIEHGKGAAREKLEITFGGAKIEKASNPAYNQDDYLDKIMTKEIKDIKILDNIVIVDGYAFEIDRSVPKVGRYAGQEEDLIIPNVTVSEVELINDDKQAKFTITAQEEEKGIKKIEVWLDGKKIDEHDENYNNITTQITKECTVNKNGTYTVKVYGELTISKTVEVQGIISSVKFEPNGDTTYKKVHTTKITIEGSTESIASIKYVWIKDDGVNEPSEDKFTETCPSDGVITGGNETMTGTYYLWVLLETVNGKKNICASNAFNFDNEGPTSITAVLTPKSGDTYTLNINCIKGLSDISKINIISNEKKQETIKQSDKEWTIEVTKTPDYLNDVIFEVSYPTGDIFTYSMITAQNYTEMWDINIDRTYSWKWSDTTIASNWGGGGNTYNKVKNLKFDDKTGKLSCESDGTIKFCDMTDGTLLRRFELEHV